MSRLFGVAINDGRLLAHALFPWRDLLRMPATESPFGWGLGYFQHNNVLVKRRPNHMGELDMFQSLEDLRTTLVLGHVRKHTVGDVRPENTHPFRFRNWLFVHHGTIPRYEAIKHWIVDSTPAFLRRSMRGDTDSEHLFYLFMAFLYDDGLIDLPDITARRVAEALRNTLRMVARFIREAGGRPGGLNAGITNGRILVVASVDRPCYWVRVNGIQDCGYCHLGDHWENREEPRAHPNVRMVATFCDPQREDQEPISLPKIPEDTALAVEEDLTTSFVPLNVLSNLE